MQFNIWTRFKLFNLLTKTQILTCIESTLTKGSILGIHRCYTPREGKIFRHRSTERGNIKMISSEESKKISSEESEKIS